MRGRGLAMRPPTRDDDDFTSVREETAVPALPSSPYLSLRTPGKADSRRRQGLARRFLVCF